MFEFSIARKYLLPKCSQLSVSLISLMSISVISLVVWLMLVFLSVTDGIEKGWLDKLTSLHAPIRLSPTIEYFSSYYHQVDLFSASSDYSCKSLREKAEAPLSDPYQLDSDMELPFTFPKADRTHNGALVDPVKGLFSILDDLGLVYQDFEVGGAMMRLEMMRPLGQNRDFVRQQYITQATYVASFSEKNPKIHSLLLPLEDIDKENLSRTFFRSLEPALIQKWLNNFPFSALSSPQGVFLPKQFQESGVLAGDQGRLYFTGQGATSIQEQVIPITVLGFYDPGIMAVGSKSILAPFSLVHTLNVSNQSFQMDLSEMSGVQVWTDDLSQALSVKEKIEQALREHHIEKYWNVRSYQEYDFAKDLLQQFQSDRTLFTLIGLIILMVACCNVISLLILLVNDKKKEIGILQAMGASKKSIALIFALCGGAVGCMSCFIGIGAALLTLRHLGALTHFLSALQGHEMFNPLFYGKTLPGSLSMNALLFILIATPILSILAGLIPAIKACSLSPSITLKE